MLNMSQQCTYTGVKINHIWSCINKHVAGRLRRTKIQKKAGRSRRLEKATRRAAKTTEGLENQKNVARLRQQDLFNTKKMLRRKVISMFNYLMAGYGENR